MGRRRHGGDAGILHQQRTPTQAQSMVATVRLDLPVPWQLVPLFVLFVDLLEQPWVDAAAAIDVILFRRESAVRAAMGTRLPLRLYHQPSQQCPLAAVLCREGNGVVSQRMDEPS